MKLDLHAKLFYTWVKIVFSKKEVRLHTYTQQYLKAVAEPLPEMQEYFAQENQLLLSLVRPGGSLLDIGCGNGRTLVALAPHVAQMVGIEYDPTLSAVARQNTRRFRNVKVITNDFFATTFTQKFSVTSAAYNLLGSAEVDGFEGRMHLLRRMLSFTEKQGYVYCAVWSDTGIAFAEQYYPRIGITITGISKGDVQTDHGTFHRFSKEEITELARTFHCPFFIREVGSVMYGLIMQQPR